MKMVKKKNLKIGDIFICPKTNVRSIVINTTLSSFDYLTEYAYNTFSKNDERVYFVSNLFSSKNLTTEKY